MICRKLKSFGKTQINNSDIYRPFRPKGRFFLIMTGSLQTAGSKDFLQWDVKTFEPILEFWKLQIAQLNDGKALDLGARDGGLSLWLAGNGLNTICSDLHNIEQTAAPLHSKFETENRISYMNIDATDIPFKNEFDVIVFKSVLGGIGAFHNEQKQRQALASIYGALKPGGILLFAENMEASALHMFVRKKFTSWGSNWSYPQLPTLKEQLSIFDETKILTTGFLATFGRSENQRSILSFVDKVILNHITPAKHKYLAFGYARKKK